MSRQQLAEKLRVSKEVVAEIEDNYRVPSLTEAMEIAHLFGVKVEEIFQAERKDSQLS